MTLEKKGEAWSWVTLYVMPYNIIPEPKDNNDQWPFQGINYLIWLEARKLKLVVKRDLNWPSHVIRMGQVLRGN